MSARWVKRIGPLCSLASFQGDFTKMRCGAHGVPDQTRLFKCIPPHVQWEGGEKHSHTGFGKERARSPLPSSTHGDRLFKAVQACMWACWLGPRLPHSSGPAAQYTDSQNGDYLFFSFKLRIIGLSDAMYISHTSGHAPCLGIFI